jgi:hypothetical protein
MLEQLLEMLDEPEAGLVRRLEGEPRALGLVASAVSAATAAETQAKIRALGQVAARGLADDARLDESAFLISLLREVEVIDVRLLLGIEARGLEDEQGADTQEILDVSVGVAEALNAKLLRLALVETPGMSFRGLHKEVRLAPLGGELLALLRATGQGDPLN